MLEIRIYNSYNILALIQIVMLDDDHNLLCII